MLSSMTPGLIRLSAITVFVFSLPALQAQLPAPGRGGIPSVLPSRQNITPAGVHTTFSEPVYGVSFGSDPEQLFVLVGLNDTRDGHGRLMGIRWRRNEVMLDRPIAGTLGIQGVVFDRVAGRALVSGTVSKAEGEALPVGLLASGPAGEAILQPKLGTFLAGGPAVAARKNDRAVRPVVVPMTANNVAAVVDADSGTLLHRVPTGIAPFGAVVSQDGRTAYVSNWAGRRARPGDRTMPSGSGPGNWQIPMPPADLVVVDERGVAATGTVTRIDLLTGRPTHEIATGLHPHGLAWDEKNAHLYVANNNSDTVTVIDTRTQASAGEIPVQPFGRQAFGVAPSALKLSPSGDRLYVACSGINAIAVINPMTRRILGYIPTAWYPNALDISPDGTMLVVASEYGFGYASKVPPGIKPNFAFRGSVSVIPVPEPDQLRAFTAAVAENNRLPRPAIPVPPSAPAAAVPIPAEPGQPSLIEHVVYIIKENKTYDSYFGDLPEGNGDPNFLLYDDKVIPNHRRLAREFLLLDNLYSNGRHSDDGHQWLTQAIATGYVWWPGYGGRSSPFSGNDPIAFSSRGAIWDIATAAGKSVQVFGEYIPDRPRFDPVARARMLAEWRVGASFRNRLNIQARSEKLDRLVVRDYPVWDLRYPDVVRASIFLDELGRWEKAGKMPNLSVVQLPGDHGKGAGPGVNTMRAFVADNDLALGKIVEGLTRSRFWPRMAILVIQDDAGNLPDHVDKARTAGLVISPYARRRFTDSTFYSQVSILKTIEAILNLPTLSLFDLIANDMRNSFQRTPNLAPYTAVIPAQDLAEVNPPLSALTGPAREAAIATQKMNFSAPDATPIDIYSRIEWHSARGWEVPFPGPQKAVLLPPPNPEQK